MGCIFHKWNGCKCIKCEKTRNEQHEWNGCKCEKCGIKHPDTDDVRCWEYIENEGYSVDTGESVWLGGHFSYIEVHYTGKSYRCRECGWVKIVLDDGYDGFGNNYGGSFTKYK